MIKARSSNIENAVHVFETLRKLAETEGIEDDEAKKMAASIICVLQEHELTYSQAYSVLDLTRATLEAMSASLAL